MDKCQKLINRPTDQKSLGIFCRNPHYKDGFCHLHNPKIIAEKKEKYKNKLAKINKELYSIKEIEKLTIDNAILLLIKSGYKVEKQII